MPLTLTLAILIDFPQFLTAVELSSRAAPRSPVTELAQTRAALPLE